MSETSVAPKRPASVTLVVVLVWIVALINIAWGIFLIIERNNIDLKDDLNQDSLLVAAIVQLVLGLIIALVASSLGKGSQFARFLISLIMILDIVAELIFVGSNGSRYLPGTIIAVIIALVILALLWNSKASRFFKPERA